MTRTKKAAVATLVAGAVSLGITLAAADSSSAALTFPNHGTWTCGDVSVRWNAPNNRTLSVDPHAARGRAVMQRYVSGRIETYYGPIITNNVGQHHWSTVTVPSGLGSWVAGYFEFQETGLKGVRVKVYPGQFCQP